MIICIIVILTQTYMIYSDEILSVFGEKCSFVLEKPKVTFNEDGTLNVVIKCGVTKECKNRKNKDRDNIYSQVDVTSNYYSEQRHKRWYIKGDIDIDIDKIGEIISYEYDLKIPDHVERGHLIKAMASMFCPDCKRFDVDGSSGLIDRIRK